MTRLSRPLGEVLKVLRRQRGWSQEELAAFAQLDRSYVGEIERGLVSPSLATLEKLSEALQVPISELISRSESLRKGGFEAARSAFDGDTP